MCVEVGYDGRLGVKTKGWLASNTALLSGMTFVGCADSNDGDGEVLDNDDCFSTKEPNFLSFLPPCFRTHSTICSLLYFIHGTQFVLRFTEEPDVSH